MKTGLRHTLIFLLLFVFSGNIYSEIIAIPEDFNTIQAGVDNAQEGDTVLVDRGLYRETVLFNGTNLTLASQFLITNDPDDINSTIIDGNQNGSVVRLDRGESEESLIIGFTIQNGSGSIDAENDVSGGGVHLHDASPRLSHLNVINNTAWYAAGIYYELGADSYTEYCLISGNTASIAGGGFDSYNADPTLVNCTITDNEALRGGGVYLYLDCDVSLVNTIIWANRPQEVLFSGTGEANSITISYSNLMGGINAIQSNNNGAISWGDGNMSFDPVFVDAENGDFRLSQNSPLIDAGDPQSELDEDNTWTDMGALTFLHGREDIPRITIPSDNVSFSLTEVGGNSVYQFDIRNSGYSDLTVENAVISEDNRGQFSADFPENTTLEPGEIIDFEIIFSPDSIGMFEAEFITFSDDPHWGEVRVDLNGQGIQRGGRHLWVVPDDLHDIQSAIDYSHDGDTIKVQPGTYNENINFNGKSILVSSTFLETRDPEKIERTIIRGDMSTAVVSFENGEGVNSVLSGFTITNGRDGIYCEGSSPIIKHCVITDNHAVNTIGGGFILRDNSAPIITFCTIAGNSARWGGGIYGNNGVIVELANSIMFDNEPYQAYFSSTNARNSIHTLYSDVFGGPQSIRRNNNCNLAWSNTTISEDPLFRNADRADYNLTWDIFPRDPSKSPCIDTADRRQLDDPDNSRADMGAVYFDQRVFPDLSLDRENIEFPETPVGQTSTQQILISNDGGLPLFISEQSIITIEGPPFISVRDGGEEVIIPPDSIYNSEIVFSPWIETGYSAIYRIESNDPDQRVLEIPVTGGLSVEGKSSELPTELSITEIFPNPSNSATLIRFYSPRNEVVSLNLYSLTGASYPLLGEQMVNVGFRSVSFDAKEFASGVYFVVLGNGDVFEVRKVMIVK